MRKAKHLSEYREAASLFSVASKVYSSYGNAYKNATKLADVYARKGQVQISARGNSYLADHIRSALQKIM
ncbi:hypothetical protein [Snodgrassella communis]|uniref:hypothetical protein n=1 Tax=Snodgrassella communis TaxID=2946699 RepID=UPI001EF46B67|nr:hypothetical protein [Snodgrassella communis]